LQYKSAPQPYLSFERDHRLVSLTKWKIKYQDKRK
jgi:hypothetical protein